MSEYELLDLAGTYHGIGVSSIMAYFTVFVSYLVAIYAVGSKLTRTQVTIITGLFLMMQFYTIWGTVAYFYRARKFQDMIEQPLLSLKPHQLALPMLILGVLASLKFMWDVRHKKSD